MAWAAKADLITQYLHQGDEVTFMPKHEPRQQGLSPDFERGIEESVRPQAVAPLKSGYMKPMDPITNLPGEEGDINVANIPF